MKKPFTISAIIFFVFILVVLSLGQKSKDPVAIQPEKVPVSSNKPQEVGMANPASKNCEEKGGELEIVTLNDNSQIGLCKFSDYTCEEWAYYRDECNLEEDSQKIEQELKNKGLNLSGMKVVIKKHLGKYIAGSVVPISEPAGGGYVFAVKTEDTVKVLADGNGMILCEAFKEYPDFPTYLVPECVDQTGNIVTR